RDDHERADQLLQGDQLLCVSPLEGHEVDENVRTRAECLPQGLRVGTVDLDVLDAGRELVLAAAADNSIPATFLESRDQCSSGLAAAAEEKCAPRHRRDDSSLIF